VRRGKALHYSIGNGLLYPTTRGGEQYLNIATGPTINGQTLRELTITEIHNKGHYSAQRNPQYSTEYLFWP